MAVDPSEHYNIVNGTDYIQCPLNLGGDIECNPIDILNDQIWHVDENVNDTKLECTIDDGGTKYYMVAVSQDGGAVTSTSDASQATKFKINGDDSIQLLGTSGTDEYFLHQSGAKVKVKKSIKQTWTWNKTQLGSNGTA